MVDVQMLPVADYGVFMVDWVAIEIDMAMGVRTLSEMVVVQRADDGQGQREYRQRKHDETRHRRAWFAVRGQVESHGRYGSSRR